MENAQNAWSSTLSSCTFEVSFVLGDFPSSLHHRFSPIKSAGALESNGDAPEVIRSLAKILNYSLPLEIQFADALQSKLSIDN